MANYALGIIDITFAAAAKNGPNGLALFNITFFRAGELGRDVDLFRLQPRPFEGQRAMHSACR